jgi:uncharacterized membrane protein YccC
VAKLEKCERQVESIRRQLQNKAEEKEERRRERNQKERERKRRKSESVQRSREFVLSVFHHVRLILKNISCTQIIPLSKLSPQTPVSINT